MARDGCIFCRGGPLTREHVLPKWLRSVSPTDEAMVYFREVGGTRVHWQQRAFDATAKSVCEPCNTGWMSALEAEARPVLEASILGRACEFDAGAQAIAARWAFKTCLVFAATQTPKTLPPPAHYGTVMVNPGAPPNVAVWLASHYRGRDDPLNSVYVQQPLALRWVSGSAPRVGRFGYLAFLALGRLAFLVVGHRYGNRTEIDCAGEPLREALIRIWPPLRAKVEWPPRYAMDRDLLTPLTTSPGGLSVRVWSGETPGAAQNDTSSSEAGDELPCDTGPQ